ncbi:MAG: serine hydroxymethyltransferase [Gammaproteobacteria bacterium]|nr:serine hydroxymethyltransferase [Gammaproteobacteria bacterium]
MIKKQDWRQFDPQLFGAIEQEKIRQENHLELIASENYASQGIMDIQGSVLTNKYAEGYPGKRYYGGCEFVDLAENLAIERAKTLFGADYANVQPHSGSQANAAVMMALLNPGDTFLGLALDQGGHLTHGCKANFSGKLFNAIPYGIHADTGLLNYDQLRDLAKQHRPKLIVGGFSAYSRIMDWQIFREIADEVGALLMVDMAHIAGLVAAGLYPNPIPFADVVTSTTHKTLRGPRGGLILCKENPDLQKKFNSLVFPGTQGGPLMHVIAAKALCFLEALQPEFKTYQTQVVKNARALAKGLQDQGFDIISGGTDNHLMLVSLLKQGITGKVAEAALGDAYITINKNAIPNDPASPFVTSGMRLGTPALTTRGMMEKEFQQIALWITEVVHHPEDQAVLARVRESVKALCKDYPVYIDQKD